MFDTSVVRAHELAGPRRATFVFSLVLHSLAVLAAAVLAFASTQLPIEPPKQFELYRSTQLPSQPPPPLGHPRQHQQQQQHQQQHQTITTPRSVVAPETIPQQTTTAASEPGPATNPITTDTMGGDSGPIGSPFGVPGGVGEGEVGTGTSTGPYTPGGVVTSAHVISRVEPRFPPAFVHSVRSAIVVVRCVIGQDGSIRDAEIVTSSFPPFNDAVLSALRQWKFAPGVMHGQPVDTWFELTVNFHVR